MIKLCEYCHHATAKHSANSCTHERADSYEAGYAPMALGPCGCQAVTIEPLTFAEIYEHNITRFLLEFYNK
jgi:hypothetical protein